MKKKGAIPIPYIIAIILGVIVLSLVAYWLFFSTNEFGGTISESTCKAKKMAYCNEWRMNAWEQPNGVTGFSTDCNSISDENNYYAPECCEFTWAHSIKQSDCE